jgi:protein ImuB
MSRRVVDRMACVDVPALPLQLLLIEHPDWSAGPVAVVAEDRPQAPLLYVTERARRAGILPGLRFTAALGLTKNLRAGTVSETRVQRAVAALTERLRRFSPAVQPDTAHPGVYWLDACGLDRLFPSLRGWAGSIVSDLDSEGFVANVVVGFTRFATYALARSGRGVKVFDAPSGERAAAREVRLSQLDLDADVRERLAALGVRTVGDLVDLPRSGVERRFGEEAERLHRLAAGDLWDPLVGAPPEERHQRQLDLDAPETDAARLLFLVKQHLDPLLADLARRSRALTALSLDLRLDDGRSSSERLATAAPTLDTVQILGLVRLRIETLRLSSGVVSLGLTAEAAPAASEQLRLFAEQTRRDPDAVGRALARLRAELGDDVVVRARLRDAHLPEARFFWEPVTRLPGRLPTPRRAAAPPLVRRAYDPPTALPPRPRHEPDGWLLRGIAEGRVERLLGPYVLSGGWWRREVHRDYYFAETSRGELLWIYYDRARRRYYLAGRVE